MTFIKGIASLAAAMLIGLTAPSAQAGYVMDLTQVGSNVVETGGGPIDTTGLTLRGPDCCDLPLLVPSGAQIVTGPSGSGTSTYSGVFSGPLVFGTGGTTFASIGSGDPIRFLPTSGELGVPSGYVSGSPLSDTAIYDNQTFMSLGATPGTYEWTWGTGPNQNLTLVIGTPESSTWAMMLLGFTGLGFMGYQSAGRRRRTACNA